VRFLLFGIPLRCGYYTELMVFAQVLFVMIKALEFGAAGTKEIGRVLANRVGVVTTSCLHAFDNSIR
jgi:hypothetical protein